ncbi:MAG: tryptophan--tRNA ligase [Clostridia bacterium]|nr:tryptophan--tRNA ligase [Clostridia bacterium]MBQ3553749.1 tryptophan--tRNA ligase [Clostridia bacterium]
MDQEKKTIFSAVQPSGEITLGNYLGAIKNWVALQDEYNCIYSIVDMHAITVRQTPAELRKRSLELLMQYIACGIDPEKAILFIQSHVPAHAQMAWVLSCNTQMGELSRMTQFKDKSKKHAEDINAGLFTYPVLMAADILVYKADLVPVGHDQLQHLELARDIANRFNYHYGDVLTVPEAYIPKTGARVMSLQAPENKMSKSDPNPNGFIKLLETRDDTIRKFKRAVTDSDNEVRKSPDKPGISNLLDIYCAVTGKTVAEAEAEFAGKGYGDFKIAVGETVADSLAPIRERYEALAKDKAYVESIYKNGAEQANYIARKVLSKVYKKVGFIV